MCSRFRSVKIMEKWSIKFINLLNSDTIRSNDSKVVALNNPSKTTKGYRWIYDGQLKIF